MIKKKRGSSVKTAHQHKLMHALGFSERDLIAYTSRDDVPVPELPPRFVRRYPPQRAARDVVIVFALGLILFAAWLEWPQPVLGMLFLVDLLILVGVAIVYFAVSNRVRPVKRPGKTIEEPIETVEGLLYQYLVKPSNKVAGDPQYQVAIGDYAFDVAKDVYEAFEDHLPYRLYYNADTHTIVAAEVLIPD